MMDTRIFWTIIEAAKEDAQDNNTLQANIIKGHLHNFSLEDIIAFQFIYKDFLAGAYTSDIWAAATVILQSCDATGLEAFRGWLIAQGEYAYRAALDDADFIDNLICDAHLKSMDINEDYLPLMRLDLLAHDVMMHKLSAQQYHIDTPTRKLLAELNQPNTKYVDCNWEENNVESLRKIVPNLVATYRDFEVDSSF